MKVIDCMTALSKFHSRYERDIVNKQKTSTSIICYIYNSILNTRQNFHVYYLL